MDKLKETFMKFWQIVTTNHLAVSVNGQKKFSLPIIVPIVLALLCGEIIPIALAALLFGVTYKIEKAEFVTVN